MTVLVYDNKKTTPPTTHFLYIWTFDIFILVCMFIVESDGE